MAIQNDPSIETKLPLMQETLVLLQSIRNKFQRVLDAENAQISVLLETTTWGLENVRRMHSKLLNDGPLIMQMLEGESGLIKAFEQMVRKAGNYVSNYKRNSQADRDRISQDLERLFVDVYTRRYALFRAQFQDVVRGIQNERLILEKEFNSRYEDEYPNIRDAYKKFVEDLLQISKPDRRNFHDVIVSDLVALTRMLDSYVKNEMVEEFKKVFSKEDTDKGVDILNLKTFCDNYSKKPIFARALELSELLRDKEYYQFTQEEKDRLNTLYQDLIDRLFNYDDNIVNALKALINNPSNPRGGGSSYNGTSGQSSKELIFRDSEDKVIWGLDFNGLISETSGKLFIRDVNSLPEIINFSHNGTNYGVEREALKNISNNSITIKLLDDGRTEIK
ncbi:MAG: hypothetical protein ACOCXG_00220 [Nanoarchaeota archaeon]